jgi:hypothetical protein
MTIEMAYNELSDESTALENSAITESPFCHELRSKKFFMLDTFATEASQYMDGSNHCWCYHTQQVIGPDGGKVNPQTCNPNRSCYKSSLADLL